MRLEPFVLPEVAEEPTVDLRPVLEAFVYHLHPLNYPPAGPGDGLSVHVRVRVPRLPYLSPGLLRSLLPGSRLINVIRSSYRGMKPGASEEASWIDTQI